MQLAVDAENHVVPGRRRIDQFLPGLEWNDSAASSTERSQRPKKETLP